VSALFRIAVFGQPKPKGSMRHVGKGRMVEQLAGSRPWREAVKYAALDAYAGPAAMTGPVAVDIAVTVAKPKSAPKTRRTWPSTRSSGDADKHARNVLDALVDAAVIEDDSQVVELAVRKVYPAEAPDALASPGAVITVRPVFDVLDPSALPPDLTRVHHVEHGATA
jgi:crossover junction endodeoxyribonuclease RusA